jgi:hypothetical protein
MIQLRTDKIKMYDKFYNLEDISSSPSFPCIERVNWAAQTRSISHAVFGNLMEGLMKKVFKFIIIAILFLLSLTLFNQVVAYIGKGKGQMAKLV